MLLSAPLLPLAGGSTAAACRGSTTSSARLAPARHGFSTPAWRGSNQPPTRRRLQSAPPQAAADDDDDLFFIDVCTNSTCLEGGSGTLRMLREMARPNVEEGEIIMGIATAEDAARLLEERCKGAPAAQAAEAYGLKLQGDASYAKGDLKAADEAFTKALGIDNSGLVLAQRSKVRLKLGDAAAAAQDAEAACEAKPNWAPAQLAASDAYEILEDKENALRCASNAYNIDPELASDEDFTDRVRWLQDMD